MSSDDEMESQNSAAKSAEDLNKINSGDCFKILLATDIHLGYAEEDPIRGKNKMNYFMFVRSDDANDEFFKF